MSTSAERMRRLRERRAAALAPVPGPGSRGPGGLLLPAVEESLAALRPGGRDQAAAQLARQLARTIDAAAGQAEALRVLGPQLRRVLESLGGTPAARAGLRAVPAGGPAGRARARAGG